MTTASVTPITEGQQSFHGFPVAEKRFQLSKPNGWTDKELKQDGHVTFSGSGRVCGHKYDGDLKRWVWRIEVLDVELDG